MLKYRTYTIAYLSMKCTNCITIINHISLIIGMNTLGWDCLVIPGAKKGTASATLAGEKFCGHSEGLVDAADGAETTVCSKS